jgi:glyoxylase-like metal-dependent hydrolase (beta-lactamase superfamily II)
MILQRTENAQWLSNAYLVVDRPGGHGAIVDANAATDPLAERVEREATELTHILLTHWHPDHVAGLEELKARFGVPVLAHELCAGNLAPGLVDDTIGDGDVVESGDLRIEAIHTPGHADDHLALLVDDSDCITADVIFKGTVGGTVAPGETGFAELRHSIMERLMKLPPQTRIHPGHREPSTIGAEWEHNPFVRIWRGLDDEGSEPCKVGHDDPRDATLVLWAPDYDGTNKAWVRFPDGRDEIVGGSQIQR